jgi:hypothetical protein
VLQQVKAATAAEGRRQWLGARIRLAPTRIPNGCAGCSPFLAHPDIV